MSLINISNLNFSYPGATDVLFEDVSFQIDTNWKLGFIGRNGRGKTTFLNLLCGKYEYSGHISSNVTFDYFPFAVADPAATTQAVVDAVAGGYEEWELLRELSLLQVKEDTLLRPFKTLSNGEQTKVMLAALFLKKGNFLLIDEPTNHLDTFGRKTICNYLQKKSGFILVSHDRNLLDECVDHILSINKNNIEIEAGNFSSWNANREKRDQFELAENEKLKKEVRRLEKASKTKAEWSNKAEQSKIGFDPLKVEKSVNRRTTESKKAKKLMKQSKVLQQRQEHAIGEKSKLLKNLETTEALKLTQQTYRSSPLVRLNDVSVCYGDKTIVEHVSFAIEPHDRILLSGKNGSGKSSIIKLINGEPITYSGFFEKGSNLKISYVPQNADFVEGDLSSFARKYNLEESLLKSILRKLDFDRTQFDKNIEFFSSGQKKKLLLAKSLCEESHLLIWDEPLNFIDVFSKIQIETLLLTYAPTILFVEHEATFCQNIATKIVTL